MRRLHTLMAAAVLVPLALLGYQPSVAAARTGAGSEQPSYTLTKTLTRSFFGVDGELLVDSRDVTVTADKTTELRGRERIHITWSGARPSAGRASNPFGEQGLNQEYPVVILQCRGRDDASLPLGQQLSPATCWTSTRMQRSQSLPEISAPWLHDHDATPEQRQRQTGLAPWPDPTVCPDTPDFATHLTPFVSANGTVYSACTAEAMPPEAAVGASYPPAEIAAFTDADGNGDAMFEVRSSVENESLGCSDKVACSVVVIPIMGLSCDDENAACQRTGQFLPGSSNFASEGPDLAVSPSLWWSPSNWKNRFSIPITFGLPPDACNVLDQRSPTGFYGSELISQAALQWAPAYCLSKKRFKFQANAMPDEAAFSLMEAGEGAAAFVSSEHPVTGTVPVAYAPTALTGFAIGYVIDRPDNAGEFTTLRLNARLLAKLLTQSYLGSDLGRGHPGMANNPLSINLDPEFQKLNPGLDTISREAAATVLSLSEQSDVIEALTEYIASDKQAAEFVNGKPDQWGMRVNPSYKKVELPTGEWPLLDDYVPRTNDECLNQNPAPYFTQLAAPLTSLRKIAEAVLDAWPNVQTRCDRPTTADPWKLGRVARQGMGTRFMLGVVSLGDAARFGLRSAALETVKDRYVAPSEQSMLAALQTATRAEEPKASGSEDGAVAPLPANLRPLLLDQSKLRKVAGAYPGTLVVYAAAPVSGMDKGQAAKVAQFIRVSSTEGQVPGRGNGQLPSGFVPIRKSGPTKELFVQAERAAALIEQQKPITPTTQPTPQPTTSPTKSDNRGQDGPNVGTSTTGSDSGPAASQPAAEPSAEPTTDSGASPEKNATEATAPIPMPRTQSVSSPVAAKLLPVLLALGVAAFVTTGGTHAYAWWRKRRDAAAEETA